MCEKKKSDHIKLQKAEVQQINKKAEKLMSDLKKKLKISSLYHILSCSIRKNKMKQSYLVTKTKSITYFCTPKTLLCKLLLNYKICSHEILYEST